MNCKISQQHKMMPKDITYGTLAGGTVAMAVTSCEDTGLDTCGFGRFCLTLTSNCPAVELSM